MLLRRVCFRQSPRVESGDPPAPLRLRPRIPFSHPYPPATPPRLLRLPRTCHVIRDKTLAPRRPPRPAPATTERPGTPNLGRCFSTSRPPPPAISPWRRRPCLRSRRHGGRGHTRQSSSVPVEPLAQPPASRRESDQSPYLHLPLFPPGVCHVIRDKRLPGDASILSPESRAGSSVALLARATIHCRYARDQRAPPPTFPTAISRRTRPKIRPLADSISGSPTPKIRSLAGTLAVAQASLPAIPPTPPARRPAPHPTAARPSSWRSSRPEQRSPRRKQHSTHCPPPLCSAFVPFVAFCRPNPFSTHRRTGNRPRPAARHLYSRRASSALFSVTESA